MLARKDRGQLPLASCFAVGLRQLSAVRTFLLSAVRTFCTVSVCLAIFERKVLSVSRALLARPGRSAGPRAEAADGSDASGR